MHLNYSFNHFLCHAHLSLFLVSFGNLEAKKRKVGRNFKVNFGFTALSGWQPWSQAYKTDAAGQQPP
ncbi:hypothetical protein C5167_038841 [Papaver somniferum]|uniref:Secreted protein n=1 Tax=Papaver somniferum TaxID=3469 RepID=A0A4Y7IE19_PAPSO|nr:hypothetical protein C5167_038841 [Papaver somniferum]